MQKWAKFVILKGGPRNSRGIQYCDVIFCQRYYLNTANFCTKFEQNLWHEHYHLLPGALVDMFLISFNRTTCSTFDIMIGSCTGRTCECISSIWEEIYRRYHVHAHLLSRRWASLYVWCIPCSPPSRSAFQGVADSAHPLPSPSLCPSHLSSLRSVPRSLILRSMLGTASPVFRGWPFWWRLEFWLFLGLTKWWFAPRMANPFITYFVRHYGQNLPPCLPWAGSVLHSAKATISVSSTHLSSVESSPLDNWWRSASEEITSCNSGPLSLGLISCTIAATACPPFGCNTSWYDHLPLSMMFGAGN